MKKSDKMKKLMLKLQANRNNFNKSDTEEYKPTKKEKDISNEISNIFKRIRKRKKDE